MNDLFGFHTLETRLFFQVFLAMHTATELGISQVAAIFMTFGTMSAVSLDGERHFNWRHFFSVLAIAGFIIGPGAALWTPFLVDFLEESHGWQPNVFRRLLILPWIEWGAGGILGLLIWWFVFHYALEWMTSVRDRLTRRTSTARLGRTDIRTVREFLPKPGKAYEPEKYFRSGQVFIGLDQFRKPVYIPYDTFRRSHTQLVGTTGSGKGVAAGLLIKQALNAGEAVAVIDPKDDEWAPHLCRQSAEAAGRPFVLFDLRVAALQFNLIDGATADQVEELLVAGMGLTDRGDAADYYRVKDRKAARTLAQRVLTGNPCATLADLAEAADADQAIQRDAEGFAGRLAEIACPAICAENGPSLAKLIADGACIYVIGSMRHGAFSGCCWCACANSWRVATDSEARPDKC